MIAKDAEKRSSRDGLIEKLDDGRAWVRFERHLNHPVERVWSAITDAGELRLWLGEVSLDPVVGGRISMRLGSGTITKWEPPASMEWSFDDGWALLWDLRAEGETCVLSFSSILAPRDHGAARGRILFGWHWYLDNLETVLEGAAFHRDIVPGQRYDVLAARYMALARDRT